MIKTLDFWFFCKVNFTKKNYIFTKVFEVASRHYTWLLNFFFPLNRGRHFFPLCMLFYLYSSFDRSIFTKSYNENFCWEEFEGSSLEVWITILYSCVYWQCLVLWRAVWLMKAFSDSLQNHSVMQCFVCSEWELRFLILRWLLWMKQ